MVEAKLEFGGHGGYGDPGLGHEVGFNMPVAELASPCPPPEPGLIRIAVGQAVGPHRMMINHDNFTQDEWNEGQSMSVAGWTHKCEFWVYPIL